MLVRANTKVYGNAAKALVNVRELYKRAGDADDFAAYMSELRETYARRPSLMAAFDRSGL
jgi:uncharacterized Zn finger protein